MSILVDFNHIQQRLADFTSASYEQRFEQSPMIRGIAYSLIILEWEGTASILNDAFLPSPKDRDSFIATIERLGYCCEKHRLSSLQQIPVNCQPAFIRIENLNAILLRTEQAHVVLYDYHNDLTIEYPICEKKCELITITEYSRLFREPPPESQDKSNWIKYVFYRYTNELKSLVILSLVISLLGALQPFFIMSVYNFALTSGSVDTLYWLTLFAVVVAVAEYAFKLMRIKIIASSGKDLAVYISAKVMAKLLWLPYAMTSTAGVSSQLARLKDIDTFRRLVTAESTLSYFDMPFVVVFIVAIALMSGIAALVVFGGLLLMLVFCIYSRYIYSQATSKSSRANAMVSYQWNEILRGLATIQGLPLLRVMQTRFRASHIQSSQDAKQVSLTNSKVQNMGGGLIQVIGTASIVTAVIGVMAGTSDAGAMLATVILVWKALSPIMGIYNSISKFQSIKASAQQINNLMSFNDDKFNLEKSPPIFSLDGQVSANGIVHRYMGMNTGLTNLGFNIKQGDKVAICGDAGCGKTTLINILAGLEVRYQGAVLIDGYNIKQFNSYRFRNAICHIPFEPHIFEGTIATNFTLQNGIMDDQQMLKIIDILELNDWLPRGLSTAVSQEIYQSWPTGVQQKIRLALGLGSMQKNIVLIDEPFNGVEKEFAHLFQFICQEYLQDKTVIFSSSDTSMISTSITSLVLKPDGNLKYFGTSDKYLESLAPK